MQSAVRRIGNSTGVIIPKPVLEALDAGLGDRLDFLTEGGTVTVVKARRKVREGWEEDAKRLAAEGLSQEDIDWLEAPLNSEAESEYEW